MAAIIVMTGSHGVSQVLSQLEEPQMLNPSAFHVASFIGGEQDEVTTCAIDGTFLVEHTMQIANSV